MDTSEFKSFMKEAFGIEDMDSCAILVGNKDGTRMFRFGDWIKVFGMLDYHKRHMLLEDHSAKCAAEKAKKTGGGK